VQKGINIEDENKKPPFPHVRKGATQMNVASGRKKGSEIYVSLVFNQFLYVLLDADLI
jgi:hypothetical protein